MDRCPSDGYSESGCSVEASGSLPRKLNGEEEEKVRKQEPASEFKRAKLHVEVRKNWDKFYLRNKDNFFKDRWWTQREFDELLRHHVNLQEKLNYLEVGCGVGNLLFPLKQLRPHWNFYAFDFSDNAIQLLRERSEACKLPIHATVADLTRENLSLLDLDFPAANIVTLIFVLSAIPPDKHQQAVRNIWNLTSVGGIVIVRDYGINDHAMVRFGRQCKLGERFYARQDGTMAYYFVLDELNKLFTQEGFTKVMGTYILRKTINHQKNVSVDRVFVQAVYIK